MNLAILTQNSNFFTICGSLNRFYSVLKLLKKRLFISFALCIMPVYCSQFFISLTYFGLFMIEEIMAIVSSQALLSGIWIALVILIIFISIKIKLSPIKQLSPQELTFSVNRENAAVIDIRAVKEFNKGHIVDSVHVGAEKIDAKELATVEKYKDRPIIVVCASGLTASKAANTLLKAGFEPVSLLKGGIASWTGAGLPLHK